MKVILSVEPIRFPLTGIGRYTLELARHLPGIADVEALRFFNGNAFVDDLPSGTETGETVAATGKLALKRRLAKLPILVDYVSARIDRRRKALLAGHADALYHGPNFYLPEFDGPSVVTIHDLSVLRMPECHPLERVRFMEKEIALSLKRAAHVITDSDYVRREIIDYCGWPAERVHVTALAGSGDFRDRSEAETAETLKGLNLQHQGFALYAGTIEPRKNLERLLDAYERLEPALRKRFPLVLVGYKGWNNEAVMARLRRAEREGWARYLGYVPDAALPHLFSAARLFIFPSLYEGFGLPVLEAMASGTPVVCSNAGSLPEVAGDAALQVAPEDVDGLAAAIAHGLADESWRAQAIPAGYAQAARFSWQRCAEETAAVYRLALGHAPARSAA